MHITCLISKGPASHHYIQKQTRQAQNCLGQSSLLRGQAEFQVTIKLPLISPELMSDLCIGFQEGS